MYNFNISVFDSQCIIIFNSNARIFEETLLDWFIVMEIFIFDDLPSVIRNFNFIRAGLWHLRISSMTTF